MNLKQFMETDIYKSADCVEYIGVDGMELEYDDILLYCKVVGHICSGGCLEIKLETL